MSGSAFDGSILYVVPTLGQRPDYLVETLDSLQTQDYPHVHVVLVAPPSAEAVRQLAADRGIDFVAQQGRGISNAINLGWSTFGAGHEFWAWLGDDDALAPGSARTTAHALRDHQRASMVYGRCLYVDATGEPLYEARPGPLAARLLRWGPDLVPQPGSVARAAAVRTAGLLDEELAYAMDLDIFLRLKDVGPIKYLPFVLASFRWHETSTTLVHGEASSSEALRVRRRTWVGVRGVGRWTGPAATLVARLLFKLQRRRPAPKDRDDKRLDA